MEFAQKNRRSDIRNSSLLQYSHKVNTGEFEINLINVGFARKLYHPVRSLNISIYNVIRAKILFTTRFKYFISKCNQMCSSHDSGVCSNLTVIEIIIKNIKITNNHLDRFPFFISFCS